MLPDVIFRRCSLQDLEFSLKAFPSDISPMLCPSITAFPRLKRNIEGLQKQKQLSTTKFVDNEQLLFIIFPRPCSAVTEETMLFTLSRLTPIILAAINQVDFVNVYDEEMLFSHAYSREHRGFGMLR